MKPTSLFIPAAVTPLLAAAAVVLGGCTDVPLRHATSGLDPAGSAFAPAANVEMPVPQRRVPPLFPIEMRKLGVSGEATIECLVDEKGRVHECEVVDATHPEFRRPALEAVQRWTFQPAVVNGLPVAKRIRVPIKFTFTDGN